MTSRQTSNVGSKNCLSAGGNLEQDPTHTDHVTNRFEDRSLSGPRCQLTAGSPLQFFNSIFLFGSPLTNPLSPSFVLSPSSPSFYHIPFLSNGGRHPTLSCAAWRPRLLGGGCPVRKWFQSRLQASHLRLPVYYCLSLASGQLDRTHRLSQSRCLRSPGLRAGPGRIITGTILEEPYSLFSPLLKASRRFMNLQPRSRSQRCCS